MPPKKNKSVVAASANAPAVAEIIPPLEVYMNVMCSQLGAAGGPQPTDVGRLVFRLARDTHPRTCENFRLLTTGTVIPADKKPGKDQKVFTYANTSFSRVTEDGIQGGNIHKPFDAVARQSMAATHTNSMSVRTQSPPSGQRSSSPGAGAEKPGGKNAIPESQLQSVYGPVFADENKGVVPVGYGSLLMCNSGPDTNGCQFFICTAKPHPTDYELTREGVEHMGRHYVCFGELVEGEEVLEVMVSGMAALTPVAGGGGGGGHGHGPNTAPPSDSGDVAGAPITYFIGSCGVVGVEVAPVPAPTGKK